MLPGAEKMAAVSQLEQGTGLVGRAATGSITTDGLMCPD